MINLSELTNRMYDKRHCVRFEYNVLFEANGMMQKLPVTFERDLNESPATWNVRTIIDRTEFQDTQVYSFSVNMPASNMSLTLICETGLRMLQMLIKEEVQSKSLIDMAIGLVVTGNGGK